MQLSQNRLSSSVWSITDIKQLTFLKMGARVVDRCEMLQRGQFHLRGELGVISQPLRETQKNFTIFGSKALKVKLAQPREPETTFINNCVRRQRKSVHLREFQLDQKLGKHPTAQDQCWWALTLGRQSFSQEYRRQTGIHKGPSARTANR